MEFEIKEFFKWKDEYRVGIAQIDEQHKNLFDLVNRLYSAFSAKKTENDLDDVFSDLFAYTIKHFTEEEALLEQSNYENLKDHKQKHNEFIDKLKVFHRDAGTKKLAITYQLMSLTRSWLLDHIMYEDQLYREILIKD